MVRPLSPATAAIVLLLGSVAGTADAQDATKYPRLRSALHELREARDELKAARDVWPAGYKDRALNAIGDAIASVKTILAVKDVETFRGVDRNPDFYKGFKDNPRLRAAKARIRGTLAPPGPMISIGHCPPSGRDRAETIAMPHPGAAAVTSPARTEANRNNARKSTGPRTEGGKARSRLNGLVHGLRSAEVVLPTESRDEFDAHLGRWLADWNPPTEARRLLVERAATAAWKLRRCTRVETGRMSRRSDDAVRDWDHARAEAVETAVRALPREVHNARALATLRSTRAGVDRLIGLWDELAEAIDIPAGWSDGDAHHNQLLALLGLFDPDDELAEIGDHSYGLLLANRPELAKPGDEPTAPGQVDALRSILAGLCRMKVEELEGRWSALPDPGAARASVGEEAAFAFDAQDLNLQRHEARLDREARAVIAQLARLEQTGADLLAIDRAEPEAESTPAIAPTEAIPEPAAPNEPNPDPVPPTGPNVTVPVAASWPIDHDRDGLAWPVPAWVGMPDGSPTT